MGFQYCKRCGGVSFRECDCTLVGDVWRVEDGPESARPLWSVHDGSEAIRVWAIERIHRDHEFLPIEETVSFAIRRPDGSIIYVNVYAEPSISVSADEVDDDDDNVEDARRFAERSGVE